MRNPFTSRNGAFFAAGGFLAALFITGAAQAITDAVFQYSTPKIGYLSINVAEFTPENYLIQYTKTAGYIEMLFGVQI